MITRQWRWSLCKEVIGSNFRDTLGAESEKGTNSALMSGGWLTQLQRVNLNECKCTQKSKQLDPRHDHHESECTCGAVQLQLRSMSESETSFMTRFSGISVWHFCYTQDASIFTRDSGVRHQSRRQWFVPSQLRQPKFWSQHLNDHNAQSHSCGKVSQDIRKLKIFPFPTCVFTVKNGYRSSFHKIENW